MSKQDYALDYNRLARDMRHATAAAKVSWWVGLDRQDFPEAVAREQNRIRWSKDGFRMLGFNHSGQWG